MGEDVLLINRAPVLTLWGAVVSERLGWDWECALTLGRAMAGLNAQAKGRALGIFGPPKACGEGREPKRAGLGEECWVEVCGRAVPALTTEEGLRACVKDEAIDPGKVETYLRGKFGEGYDAALEAMRELTSAYDEEELRGTAFGLYEQFRPEIPKGKSGWGRKGELDLAKIRTMAQR